MGVSVFPKPSFAAPGGLERWPGPCRRAGVGRWERGAGSLAAGRPHAPLSRAFPSVAALAPARCLSGRPPCVPAPVLWCPLSPALPPRSAWLWDGFFWPGLCFWQELAVAVHPMDGALSRQLAGRWSQGACRTPETGQCGEAPPLPVCTAWQDGAGLLGPAGGWAGAQLSALWPPSPWAGRQAGAWCGWAWHWDAAWAPLAVPSLAGESHL